MMHAKKMLLISPETLDKLKTPRAAEHSVKNIESSMHDILKQKGVNDYDKWIQYEQHFQKFNELNKKLREPMQIPIVDMPGEYTMPLYQQIVQSVGANKTLQRKASSLVSMLSQSSLMSWNDRGEVSLQGVLLPGSNILDLVNDVVKTRKTATPPVGCELFLRTLSHLNVPREYIPNNNRWAYMQHYNQSMIEKGINASRPGRQPQPPQDLRYIASLSRAGHDFEPQQHHVNRDHEIEPDISFARDNELEIPRLNFNRDRSEDLATLKFYEAFKKVYNKPNTKIKRLNAAKGVKKVSKPTYTDDFAHLQRQGVKRHAYDVFDPLLWMLPPKRSRKTPKGDISKRGTKRSAEMPSLHDFKKNIKENAALSGLDDRLMRKRKGVLKNWWNDRFLAVPKKKLKWQRLDL